MISIEQLTKEFSSKPLLDNISFLINKKEKIALVGKNGAGKTTLLNLIAGIDTPTRGIIAKSKEVTIGYLPQHMIHAEGSTVIEETRKAFAPILELQQSVDRQTLLLAERTDYESQAYHDLIEQITHDNERLQMMGVQNFDGEMEKTLLGLGFMRSDLTRPCCEFSGGWRMRIELAKILLQKPDMLLLDEPTNHLDIESIQWLETFLKNSSSSLLLVSHDRAFLDNVTTRTIEITLGKIYDYNMAYSLFVERREEQRQAQIRAYDNQQKMIQETEDFIERFRYKATKAVQVQSRIKQLEKLKRIEVEQEDRSSLRLKFPPAPRSGDFPIIAKDLGKAFDNHRVFQHVDLTIKRGEKVALVGKNGQGKTTLIRCIMGQLAYEGELKVGHNCKIGYFAQNQASLLDEELTVFDTIDRVAVGDIRTKIRDILGAFMFGGEASEKKVKVLSGGERSRLAMIRLLLEPVNLLILDEPTNHLDMKSKDVLKDALKAFDGTVIVVSHDRYFLDGLVEKVYECAEGQIKEHIGGIYDFIRKKNLSSLQELEKSTTVEVPKIEKTSEAKLDYEAQKERQRAKRKIAKQISDIEAAISMLETQQTEIEQKLSVPANQTPAIFEEYEKIKREMEHKLYEWEVLQESVSGDEVRKW